MCFYFHRIFLVQIITESYSMLWSMYLLLSSVCITLCINLYLSFPGCALGNTSKLWISCRSWTITACFTTDLADPACYWVVIGAMFTLPLVRVYSCLIKRTRSENHQIKIKTPTMEEQKRWDTSIKWPLFCMVDISVPSFPNSLSRDVASYFQCYWLLF